MSSVFSQCQNVSIHGGVFSSSEKALEDLLSPSRMADHKTVLKHEAVKREECTPGTRVKILRDIEDWVIDSSPDCARIYWLTGQAGSGKTTLAFSTATRFEAESDSEQGETTTLGGNFLCSRHFPETREGNRVIPTIAYQLARRFPPFEFALRSANRFDAIHHSFSSQIQHLFSEPWRQFEAKPHQSPQYLIIIDALDELDGKEGSELLHELLVAVSAGALQGLKFLVTSRPDPSIVDLCTSFMPKKVCRLQDVNVDEAHSDITTYLNAKLPHLAGSSTLTQLANHAGGLFIYAATVVRYVTQGPALSVKQQMDVLRNLVPLSSNSRSAKRAAAHVDELYKSILRQAFESFIEDYDDNLHQRIHILHTILCTPERTSSHEVAALVANEDAEAVECLVNDLHAVLYTKDNRIFWYHASFPDFIFDCARSNFTIGQKSFSLFCDASSHHFLLAKSCFRILDSGLRFNIANLSSSYLFDSEDVGLPDRIKASIKPPLRYASQYWAEHLRLALQVNLHSGALSFNALEDLAALVDSFLSKKCLFWIEAMNLIGRRGECSSILETACNQFTEVDKSDIAAMLEDAAKFSVFFGSSPASRSTPHLYLSSLAAWGPGSTLCCKWRKHFAWLPKLVHLKSSSTPLIIIHTPHQVKSTAISSDGKRIISGSDDKSVRVWDASSGEQLHWLTGHTHSVTSVAFSSNCKRIVSGSRDQSVRVWDASSGEQLHWLTGHSNWVTSVAFSSDGKRIVSGSWDQSVRVWDASSGEQLHKLTGHTDSVTSVAFSSDGKRIVSGSEDNSVRVWDASSGEQLHKLTGHTNSVTSVAFSSDGKRIVSGSSDQSVRVWDASSGEQLHKLTGHTNLVTSVAFSSDGKRIVSGSGDQSVRVWDASSGEQLHQLTSHTDSVTSVAFLSDGKRIVSGSWDQSVRVWDASSGEQLHQLTGHTDSVTSVAFLSDGKRIVSGSWDQSVRVWDASSGKQLHWLTGHTDSVTSVAFSSDGKRIVSGSEDNSVRVWDALSGEQLHQLTSHTDRVTSVAFSSDGKRILSGSDDNSVRVWDTFSYTIVSPLHKRKHLEIFGACVENKEATHQATKRRKITGDTQFILSPVHEYVNSLAIDETYDWDSFVDGWIQLSTQKDRLMWVADDVRRDLYCPRTLLLISRLGSARLDFSGCQFGDRWATCYAG